MENIKQNVANNLILLRKKHDLTQIQLAEKLGYSHKSISKWEHADSLPDIAVLYSLTKIYNVTLDYLVSDQSIVPSKPQPTEQEIKEKKLKRMLSGRKISLILLSQSFVWLLATIIFLFNLFYASNNFWEVFTWAVPCTFLVFLHYNKLWGNNLLKLIFQSLFCWSFLTAVFLQFSPPSLWMIYFLGLPIQSIFFLTYRLK